MADPVFDYGAFAGPALPADPVPTLPPTDPTMVARVFTLQNPQVERPIGTPEFAVFSLPYIGSNNTTGLCQVAIWQWLPDSVAAPLGTGGWFLCTDLGNQGVITLQATSGASAGIDILAVVGSNPFSPMPFGVPIYLQIAVPDGIKSIHMGMTTGSG